MQSSSHSFWYHPGLFLLSFCFWSCHGPICYLILSCLLMYLFTVCLPSLESSIISAQDLTCTVISAYTKLLQCCVAQRRQHSMCVVDVLVMMIKWEACMKTHGQSTTESKLSSLLLWWYLHEDDPRTWWLKTATTLLYCLILWVRMLGKPCWKILLFHVVLTTVTWWLGWSGGSKTTLPTCPASWWRCPEAGPLHVILACFHVVFPAR